MKRLMTSAVYGITIGLLISIIMSALFGEGEYAPLNPFSDMGQYYAQRFDSVTILLISVCIWAMIGFLFKVADGLFEKPWSLLRMTLSHFCVTAIGFTGLALLAGWFPIRWGTLLSFELMYCLIYLMIYVVNYRSMRRQISQINQHLQP